VLPYWHEFDLEWQRGLLACILVVQLVSLRRVWEEGVEGLVVTVGGASSSLELALGRADPVLPYWH